MRSGRLIRPGAKVCAAVKPRVIAVQGSIAHNSLRCTTREGHARGSCSAPLPLLLLLLARRTRATAPLPTLRGPCLAIASTAACSALARAASFRALFAISTACVERAGDGSRIRPRLPARDVDRECARLFAGEACAAQHGNELYGRVCEG